MNHHCFSFYRLRFTFYKSKTFQTPHDTPEVRLSKALSYILRHGAVKAGLSIRSDGFISVHKILALPKFKGYTLADIQRVVEENDKQRFTLCHTSDWLTMHHLRRIRLMQTTTRLHHALDVITDPAELTTLLHGTYHRYWPSIANEGLRRGTRNHIHLAVGLPGENGVISGMRTSAQIHIYIDAARAMADGIQFLRSTNGVILTEGEGKSGILPPRYFSRVLDKDGNSLLQPNHSSVA
ncbi:KptA family-domain-containing protein [Syncephalis plumigaleata]|nr:KptA family-domain-containing protein [Syncephalis plumigaleata]